jgi:Protein of unknown function (DUF4235)
VSMTDKVIWKVYVAAVGTVATIGTQKLLTVAWKTVTGKEPPSGTDPETPLFAAATWALASGVGVGMAQFVTRRFAARRWRESTTKAPNVSRTWVPI